MNFEKMYEAAKTELIQYRGLAASENASDREKAAVIEAAVGMLPQIERDVLEQSYMYRTERAPGFTAKLQVKHGISRQAIYREKKTGILHYCICSQYIRMAQKLKQNN